MMEPQMNSIAGNGFMTMYSKKEGKVRHPRHGGRRASLFEAIGDVPGKP